jgi:hypothetical protein
VTTCLALASCTHAPWHPAEGWVASKTDHVTVFTDALSEHRFSQEWLELSHAAYSAFLPTAAMRRQNVDVLWVKSQPGWFLRFFWPNDDPRNAWALQSLPTGGAIGRNGLIVLETRDQNAAATQLAHLFIASAVPRADIWLHVGLARYMARARIHRKGPRHRACFGGSHFDEPVTSSAAPGPESSFAPRALDPVRGTGRNVTMPLERVLRDDWYHYDREGRYWYEYTAYGFVHYLIHGHSGWHRTRFPIFLEALASGSSTDEALALAYPHILPHEWDDRVSEHVRPPPGGARRAATRTVAQGICLDMPPPRSADMEPVRVPVDEASIRGLLSDLGRMDLFRRHANWLPDDIIAETKNRRGGDGRNRSPTPSVPRVEQAAPPNPPIAPSPR